MTMEMLAAVVASCAALPYVFNFSAAAAAAALLRYQSGARYEGEWRNNLKDGRGVYYFPKVKNAETPVCSVCSSALCPVLRWC
jgi:hypothetical protein